MRFSLAQLGLVALAMLPELAMCVKKQDFKTCDQSGFCKRNRAYADNAVAHKLPSPYGVDAASLNIKDGVLTGTVWKTVEGETDRVELPLEVYFLANGVARVRIDETKRRKGEIELRNESKARKERYDEAGKWALTGEPVLDRNAKMETQELSCKVTWSEWQNVAEIEYKPFKMRFLRHGEVHVVLNEQSFLNVEHWRPKPAEGADETMWEETFGGNTDTKPRGPESIALDITFPGYEHVYGIPEHATRMKLKTTRGGEGAYSDPYRLYNADVFEYEVDSPMTLYGSIPFMQAHKPHSTVGVFWLSGAETWVDVTVDKTNPLYLSATKGQSTHTHWISESGVLDVFVMLGPDAAWLFKQYGDLTGFTTLPQEFALGYHQCRWNYVSDDDVKDVDAKMDNFDIPYDVIWLDIEYTKDKKYFTWDDTFKNPLGMQQQLDARQRKLVTIIDPHIKNDNDYSVRKELMDQGLAVKNKDGKDYDGWCWPGSSYWIDCFNSKAREWWKTNFKYDKFKGTSSNVFIWNDMNEPSVFNGPEITMPKDNLHHDNWEHRDLHNIYGMTFHNATYEALKTRAANKEIRPFVLTRAFFAGSQRTAAMWTGDNEAKWEHLQAAVPMLLTQGISGMPFAGADVGGFFGNPSDELLTRWYQAGAFYPFFRAHAHIDTKRREPYLKDEPYVSIIRDAIKLRYSLLPSLYTAFHRASWEGMPIMRPMWIMFPDKEAGFDIDDQFFFGDTGLLVKPVVHEGATTVNMWVPDDEVYYDYYDYTIQLGHGAGEMEAPLNKIPIIMRGGHIFTRKDRPRRSSGLMKHDPYTLVVNLNKNDQAGGVLYVDDGSSFDYKSGQFLHKSFIFNGPGGNVLTSGHVNPEWEKAKPFLDTLENVLVEKIIVVGLKENVLKGRKTVKVEQGKDKWEADVEYTPEQQGRAAFAVVKNPRVGIAKVWEMKFSE